MGVGEQEIARLARWFEMDGHLSERAAADALAMCEAKQQPRQAALELKAKQGSDDVRCH